jgi:hypothetical protein
MVGFRSIYYTHNCSATPNFKKSLNKLIQFGYGEFMMANFLKSCLYIFPEQSPDKLQCFSINKDQIEEVSLLESFSSRYLHLENVLLGFINENKINKNITKKKLIKEAESYEQVFFILDYFYCQELMVTNNSKLTKVIYDYKFQDGLNNYEYTIIFEDENKNIYIKKYLKNSKV